MKSFDFSVRVTAWTQLEKHHKVNITTTSTNLVPALTGLIEPLPRLKKSMLNRIKALYIVAPDDCEACYDHVKLLSAVHSYFPDVAAFPLRDTSNFSPQGHLKDLVVFLHNNHIDEVNAVIAIMESKGNMFYKMIVDVQSFNTRKDHAPLHARSNEQSPGYINRRPI